MKRTGFLNLDERLIIEDFLNKSKSFSFIAYSLNRSTSTITREIKRNSSISYKTHYLRFFNNCKNRRNCNYRSFKNGKFSCINGVQLNSISQDICPNFEEIICHKRFKSPYVCNGCKDLSKCIITKTVYLAKEAEEKSKTRISQSRMGIALNYSQLEELNIILKELISKKNQSPAIIAYNNQDAINVSVRTIYNYINSNILDTRNIDLPYKVRYRPRKQPYTKKVQRNCRLNRTYDDFNQYLDNNSSLNIVEIDTVEGVKGGKCLLTIYFRSCGLQLAYLRDHNNSRSVSSIFNMLYKILGHQDFSNLFEVILTDNGVEFSNPQAIENHYETIDDITKIIPRSKLFYCDAASPTQKSECERNHKFIRRFIPKGKTFNNYNQTEIDLMMNNINSYNRKKINHQSPSKQFIFLYGKAIANKLGIHIINPNNVTLSSTIFK